MNPVVVNATSISAVLWAAGVVALVTVFWPDISLSEVQATAVTGMAAVTIFHTAKFVRLFVPLTSEDRLRQQVAAQIASGPPPGLYASQPEQPERAAIPTPRWPDHAAQEASNEAQEGRPHA